MKHTLNSVICGSEALLRDTIIHDLSSHEHRHTYPLPLVCAAMELCRCLHIATIIKGKCDVSLNDRAGGQECELTRLCRCCLTVLLHIHRSVRM